MATTATTRNSIFLKPPPKPLPPCVPFLPHDNDALSDPTAAAVVHLLNERLGSLLAMPPQQFWQHVAHDASLRRALDTYLQFRRRPHDPKPIDGDDDDDDDDGGGGGGGGGRGGGGGGVRGSAAGAGADDDYSVPSPAEDALARRVFIVFRRLTTANEPGSPLTREQQGQLLYDRWLVDLPKLIDVCVLFAPDNHAAVVRGRLTRVTRVCPFIGSFIDSCNSHSPVDARLNRRGTRVA